MARKKDDERWKWVVMIAVYFGIVILSASAFMAGILYVAILNKYNDDKAKSSLIVALNAGLLSLLGPLASILVDKSSCRVSMVTGALLLIISGVSSAFVNNLDWLLVTYGLIGGVGYALVSVPFSIVLGYYFDDHRDLIIAMSTAVIGLGMLIASPVALYLVEHFSLDETFLVIAAINSHLVIVGVICRPSRRELSLQENSIASGLKETMPDNFMRNTFRNRVHRYFNNFVNVTNLNILTNVSFVFFLVSTMAWNAMLSIALVHLPNYASVLGATDVQITLLMTCFSVSNTGGRFLAALLVAKSGLDLLSLHVVSLGLLGAVTSLYPLYSGQPGAMYGFAVVAGLLTGVPNSLMTPISIQMVGVEKLSAAHGQEYLFAGIGFIAGPPIAGALYQRTESYVNSFIFAGCVNILGGILAIVSRLTMKKLPKHKAVTGHKGTADIDTTEI